MYNQDKLIDIIKKSQNGRSLNEFSRISGVDSAYLSRILNKKKNTPPSPEILEKIANASSGIASYEELMIVCGYLGNPTTAIYNFSSDNDKTIIYDTLLYIYKNKIDFNNIQTNGYITNLLKELDTISIEQAFNIIKLEIQKGSLIWGVNYSDNPEVVAIARNIAKLSPEKKDILKNLLKLLSEENKNE